MADLKQVYQKPLSALDTMGEELAFYLRALAGDPALGHALPEGDPAAAGRGHPRLRRPGRHRRHGRRDHRDDLLHRHPGRPPGYAALNQIGTAAFSGFVSAYFNTREIAPLVAGIALAATVGCGFTAQLGAMRISEEVDALEVMAIPSMPFLVTTRIVAGLVAIVPLYVIGLLSSYFATRLTVTQFYGQSAGTYDHYFNQFLPPGDVLWSFGKVLVFAVVVILIHCYHGYTASGGPAGVGVAVGRAVRTSIVAVNVIDLFLSMAIWGSTTTVRLAG